MLKKFKKKAMLFWLGMSAIFLLFVLFNVWQALSMNVKVAKEQATVKEEARAANLAVILIEAKDCSACAGYDSLFDYIEKNGGIFTKVDKIQSDSPQAKELMAKYQIANLPGLIVEGELAKKEKLSQLWAQTGQIIDNVFVYRQTMAPYQQASDGMIKGLFEVTVITEPNCAGCYDPAVHQKIMAGYGALPQNVYEVSASSAEGKILIKKYGLLYAPTIIISPEVDVYEGIKQVWPKVGKIAEDGSYVFNQGVTQMGGYKDLATGKIVLPPLN